MQWRCITWFIQKYEIAAHLTTCLLMIFHGQGEIFCRNLN